MFCVYCGNERDDASREHVVPQVLGGAVEPRNPFLLEVCSRCNWLCGTYVDGPFAHNFFINGSRSDHARRFANLGRGDIVPLAYMGTLRVAEVLQGRICEHFLGPTGDLIYHFHEPYPELSFHSEYLDARYQRRPGTYDAGFVMVLLRATNPAWHRTVLGSIRDHFTSDTPIYLLNGTLHFEAGFSEVPASLAVVVERIRGWAGQPHQVDISMPVDIGDRFLAKLALGFGELLLNEYFKRSSDAALLRRFLWSVTPEQRRDLPVHGTGFLGTQVNSLQQLLGWPPGHVFLIRPISANSLILLTVLYGQHQAGIMISADASHWAGRVANDGQVYVVCPSLRRVAGPLTLGAYIAARQGFPSSNPDLANMLNDVNERMDQPPFDI